jgi:hypothetical protein
MSQVLRVGTLAASMVLGFSALASAQQVDLIDFNGKKLAVMPPKTVVVGHPIMQSVSSDMRYMVLLLADLPIEPADCVTGLFAGGKRSVKLHVMKNLRVAVIDLKQSTATVHSLPVGILPGELRAMGGGGFTLSCYPLPDSQKQEWTVFFAFPGEPAMTVRGAGWINCETDPLKPQFALSSPAESLIQLYRPGVQPMRLTAQGMNVRLANGRVFVQKALQPEVLVKPGAPTPPRAPTFFELEPGTGRRIPFEESEFDKLGNPFGRDIDFKQVVVFEPREQKNSQVGQLYELVARTSEKQTVIEHDLTDGLGVYPMIPIVLVKVDAVMIREVREVPATWSRTIRSQPVKEEAISNAKQAAVAILIFAADYDGMSPSGNDWKEKLMPYTKNAEILKDFVLLLPGVNLDKLTKPAETVLGILTTSHGTAVAYADGHVIWKS